MQRAILNFVERTIATALLLLGGASFSAAEEQTRVDLRHDVLPLLRARCVKCHGPMKHESGLNLSTPRSIARGGESGASIVAGNLDDSFLWERIDANQMPPETPLSIEERTVLQRWIEAGAPGLPTAEEAGKPGPDHWAFVPAVRAEPPAVAHLDRVRSDVDRFILAELERRGLELAPPADPTTLVRRVSIDLIGLTPSPEEIATFLADAAPGAYERMVDRYLASPRYGERWGQHWLDAAGYADSNGYFNADTDRPLAYRYRDYVIAACNADKPFDQFLQEQIAGDELAGFDPSGDVTPEMVDRLVATHFLRNAPDGTGESDGNPDEQRADRFTVIEGTVQVLASSLLGMTVQCARCHDHKFEPVTQREYYELQAIFWPAYNPDQWRQPKDRTVAVAPRDARDQHAVRSKALNEQIKDLNATLEKGIEAARQRLSDERLARLDDPARQQLQQALDRKKGDRSEAEQDLVKAHKAEVELAEDVLATKLPDFAELRDTTKEKIAALESQRPAAFEQLAVLYDLQASPPPHHLLVRGDYRALGAEVGPGVPQVLCAPERMYEVGPERPSTTGRRSGLARWLTNPRHPVVARVAVNRIWQNHFGRGIVSTTDNFGYTGAPPSHPELLDFLAVEFIEGGWSTKAIHRLILNSAVYRQSTAASESVRQADPDNLLLSRFPLLRLDAETIRDSMLRSSGELDLAVGGPYVPTTRTPTGEVVVAADAPGAARRSIYLQRRRTQPDSMLDVFDAPQVTTNCTRRNTSTIALQSLSLLNSEFVTGRASAMAARLDRTVGDDVAAKITQGFLLAFSRPPTAEERAAAEAFIATQPTTYQGSLDAQARAWRDFCQMLLASNAFLYVE
jgi:Protein of unknown function (DUF1553)/Protein of unknown function (DUF1549)/Planctomycete cytochrome C